MKVTKVTFGRTIKFQPVQYESEDFTVLMEAEVGQDETAGEVFVSLVNEVNSGLISCLYRTLKAMPENRRRAVLQAHNLADAYGQIATWEAEADAEQLASADAAVEAFTRMVDEINAEADGRK